MINRIGTQTDEAPIFDLLMQQRLDYQTLEAGLVKRLQDAIEALFDGAATRRA